MLIKIKIIYIYFTIDIKIGFEGIKEISNVLKINNSIKSIDLSGKYN